MVIGTRNPQANPFGLGDLLTVLSLIVFAIVFPLAAYRFNFEWTRLFFPHQPVAFSAQPDAIYLNAQMLVFISVSSLTVLANVIVAGICAKIFWDLRGVIARKDAIIALLVYFLFVIMLLEFFDMTSRLAHVGSAENYIAFFQLPGHNMPKLMALNFGDILTYDFNEQESIAFFVFYCQLVVFFSFAPALAAVTLCITASGFLPLRADQGQAEAQKAIEMRRGIVAKNCLYLMAMLFFFVILFPASWLNLALAFPLELSSADEGVTLSAIGAEHPLAASHQSVTLFVATAAIAALVATYVPALIALEVKRMRLQQSLAATNPQAAKDKRDQSFLVPSLQEALALVSPLLLPMLDILR